MAVTLTPGSFGGSFSFPQGSGGHAPLNRIQQRKRILDDNAAKPIEFRQFTGAEFARLSSSMQLMLLSIRQAQLSSRKAIASTAERRRRHDDLETLLSTNRSLR